MQFFLLRMYMYFFPVVRMYIIIRDEIYNFHCFVLTPGFFDQYRHLPNICPGIQLTSQQFNSLLAQRINEESPETKQI